MRDPEVRVFEDGIKHPTSVILEGTSLRTVRHSFTGFVSLEPLPAAVLLFFEENPNLSSWVALYDLSGVTKHQSMCSKTNITKSDVFQEFERFLSSFYKIRFEHSYSPIAGYGQSRVFGASQLKAKQGLMSKCFNIRGPQAFKEEMQLKIDDKTRHAPLIDSFGFERQCPEKACTNCIAIISARIRSTTT
jgi:hypothetical protein